MNITEQLEAAKTKERELWLELEAFEKRMEPMNAELKELRSRWSAASHRAQAFQTVANEMATNEV